jgi:hypothetical protein
MYLNTKNDRRPAQGERTAEQMYSIFFCRPIGMGWRRIVLDSGWILGRRRKEGSAERKNDRVYTWLQYCHVLGGVLRFHVGAGPRSKLMERCS